MVKSRAEQLAIADTHLTSSFIGFIACAALYLAWAFMVAATRGRDSWLANLSESQVLTLRMGFYGWYAHAAGTAARLIGGTWWHYTAWVCLAPAVAALQIPLVSTVAAVSPVSIKFLLGGQLQRSIQDEMHQLLYAPTTPGEDMSQRPGHDA